MQLLGEAIRFGKAIVVRGESDLLIQLEHTLRKRSSIVRAFWIVRLERNVLERSKRVHFWPDVIAMCRQRRREK
jgi:hypothetical protein